MAGMFPTFVADPNDRNRRFHGKVGPTWPASLRAAYYVALAGAVLLLLTGMLMLASGAPKDANAEFAQAFTTNMRIVAGLDILLGLTIAGVRGLLRTRREACAPRLRRGGRRSRVCEHGRLFHRRGRLGRFCGDPGLGCRPVLGVPPGGERVRGRAQR